MAISFAKYEGLGNDFVVLEGLAQSASLAAAAEQAALLCDRHRGLGADGVLLIEHRPSGGAPAMRVFNADGSRPEMCGNGIRCVALHLVRNASRPPGIPFEIETDAGPHLCNVAARERQSDVEVQMRPASLAPEDIPVVVAGSAPALRGGAGALNPVLDEPFSAAQRSVLLSCVSMGNPHAVTFDEIAPDLRVSLGPLLEKHQRFPRGANIGFARSVGPQSIELAVWERGVGFTEACGTGACACAVAAVETGRATRHVPIDIHLPGGTLQILVGGREDRISMTGPARHVFDGTFEL
jgi:diaminopimelate epimerase